MILIIGTLRSGTLFTQKLLDAATGMHFGHDALEPIGGVSGYTCSPNMDWCPSGFNPQEALAKAKLILHQVRHPLNCIRSMEIMNRGNWHFIAQSCPQVKEDMPFLSKAMRYWLYWNKRCERYALHTYRVEDLKHAGERLGVSSTLNTREQDYSCEKITVGDLLYEDEKIARKILAKASEYGYYMVEEGS